MSDDPREAAARYLARTNGEPGVEPRAADQPHRTAADRAAIVETAIEQAIRQGAFDDLPGAGKPLPGLGETHDPDWWIRQKIQTEDLHGLGPAALTLRVEDAALTARLDELRSEAEVRETLDDFNERVRFARMQLQGGPPVVTALRDVEAEVSAWHDRRAERAPEPAPAPGRRRWFRRR